MTKFLLTSLLLASSATHAADTISTLKSTPATKYDIGALTLELIASTFTQKLPSSKWDREVSNDNFKSYTLYHSTQRTDTNLFFVTGFEAKSKFINEQNCQALKGYIEQQYPTTNLFSWSFHGTDPSKAGDHLQHKVVMQAEENSAFKVDC